VTTIDSPIQRDSHEIRDTKYIIPCAYLMSNLCRIVDKTPQLPRLEGTMKFG